MKKHLIAAAVAGALAVPAMAQVTVGGRIDTSVGSAKNQAGNTTTRMSGSVLTTNQLVLSGSEDLGGGLKAGFSIVTGFASDASTSSSEPVSGQPFSTFNFGDRGMQVGVSGGFGAIDLGRTTGTMMNSTTASGVTGNIGNLTAFNVRPNNMISYTTPNLSGVTFRVVHSLGAEAKPNTKTQTEYSLQYSAGPLLARVAMANASDVELTSVAPASTNIFGTTGTAPTTITETKIKETAAQVDYDLGMAKVNVRYQKRANDVNTLRDFSQYGVGAAIPLGNGLTANIDYLNSNDETDTRDFKLTSATLVKSLSKRTNVYFAYASKDTDDATKKTETLAAIGVRHSF